MAVPIYNNGEITKGSTLSPILFTFTLNAAPANIISASCFFVGKSVAYNMTVLNGLVAIIDGPGGVIRIEGQFLNWVVGVYTGNMVLTLANGWKKVYVQVKITVI